MVGYKNNLVSVVIVSCLWFAAFASLYSDSLNSVALYVVLPIAFILSLLRNGCSLATNTYMKKLIMLYIWCLLACLWATNLDLALRDMRQILGTFLIAFIFVVNSKDQRLLPWLYGSYIVLFASAWWYAKTHILIDIGDERFRLNDEKLNANTMAYYLFYVTFLIYVLGEIVCKSFLKKMWGGIFWLMLPLSFLTAFLTASRQVLIIQVPLILFLLYIRYIKDKNLKKKILFSIFMLAVIIYFTPFLLEQYDNSFLATRSELKMEDDPRSKLLRDAINVGWENFPLGVGPANYIHYSPHKQFSHNTYTELWANLGIIGLALYLWLLWSFVRTQWQRYKFFRKKEFLIFLLFGIIFAFDGIFYVFHNGVWLMSFFILVATHSEVYYQKFKTIV